MSKAAIKEMAIKFKASTSSMPEVQTELQVIKDPESYIFFLQ
jgi:hypothetical protein